MKDSLDSQILRGDQDIDCPTCTYPVWFRTSEIVTQVPVICPCCRTRITVVDQDGSLRNLGHALESQIEQALKEAFK